MNLRDQLSGFFWLAIAIFVCFESIRVKIGTFRIPGPGFLPFWLSVILGTLSIVLVIKSLLGKEKARRIRDLWAGTKWRKAILVLVCVLLYARFLPKVGYLIATFGLMIVLYAITEKQRIWVVLGSALMTALATYVVFYLWLEVQLPKGILDF